MGTILRKTYTRPLAEGAELFTRNGARFARWTDGDGRKRVSPLTAKGDRVRERAETYTAKLRDGNGRVVEVATGCRDRDAARAVLADLERRAELQRSGLLTSAEEAIAEHMARPIAEHVEAYQVHLRSKGVSPAHLVNVSRQLRRVVEDCAFRRLSDLTRSKLEAWTLARADEGMGARTRNTHASAAIAFANWAKRDGRIGANPFESFAKVDPRTDLRRERRSLTADELARLLEAAQRRPLEDALTVRTGGRKGQLLAKVRPDERARLEAVGRERALIYKTLVLTGLRKGELASLTVGSLELEISAPYARVAAADEKARQGADIALRADLASDLRAWLRDRLASSQAAAATRGEAVPLRLAPAEPLFDVPRALFRIMDRDLAAAGIPKRDDRGRTVDVHALRTTFGTLLSRGGTSLRTAQSAMRHSDPSLTANHYTDPRLLDVAGALAVLPALPLEGDAREALRSTGTDGALLALIGGPGRGLLAPTLAPTPGRSSASESRAVQTDTVSTIDGTTSAPTKTGLCTC